MAETLSGFRKSVRPALRASAHSEGGRLRRVLYAVQLEAARKFGTMEEQLFLLAQAFYQRGGLFLPVFQGELGTAGVRYAAAGLRAAGLDWRRFQWRQLGQLRRLIHEHQIEIIHWNFFSPLSNGYVWALSLLNPGVKHYFTDHNSREAQRAGGGRVKRLAKRMLLRRYGRVIGVSRYVADCLRNQGVWPEPECCLHFVNTDRFRPDAATRDHLRRELGAEDRFVLMTVAQLIRAKGVDVAIRALTRLPERIVLWVAGAGAAADELRLLTRELGLESRVRFLGLQSDVAPLMQAADCFVCPSRWEEAAGLVNIEAQACGLPVVASHVGGIPEYVADGRTGLLFPVGDDAALAGHLRRLYDEPHTRRALGETARERVVAEFSAGRRLRDYLDLYRERS